MTASARPEYMVQKVIEKKSVSLLPPGIYYPTPVGATTIIRFEDRNFNCYKKLFYPFLLYRSKKHSSQYVPKIKC